MGRTLQRMFQDHPLAMPPALIVLGGGGLALLLTAFNLGAVTSIYAVGICALMVVAGVLMLPFGIMMAVRRRRNVVVLRCPHCRAESRSSTPPFRVDRPGWVDYAHVFCSQCGADFTVDKRARLE